VIRKKRQKAGVQVQNRYSGSAGAMGFWDRVWDGSAIPYHRVMGAETSQSYRYIVRSPDVRGGNARVEDTRIAVHDVIGLLQNGETVDSVVTSSLPTLTKAQVYECLAYYEDHRGEIDLLVAQQMARDQR